MNNNMLTTTFPANLNYAALPGRARDRAARMVAGNRRIRRRLPRITAYAVAQGFIGPDADAATNAARIVRTRHLVRNNTKAALTERLENLIHDVMRSAHASRLVKEVYAARTLRSTTKAGLVRAYDTLAAAFALEVARLIRS